jgi:BlaI family transcriptional regulator, penicillinase repressor
MSSPHRLSRRERQIMEIVYRLGEATAAQILEQIEDPPSYSAIRALLRILVEKQHLLHRADGPRYVYAPVVSRTKARSAALAGVIDNFFEGSAVRAAAALLGSAHGRKLTKAELDEISALIDTARKQGR